VRPPYGLFIKGDTAVKERIGRFRFSRVPKGLSYVLAIILLVVVVNVGFNRMYDFRLHQALGYGGVYTKQMVFELLSRYIGAVVYVFLTLWAVRPALKLVPKSIALLLRVVAGVVGWLIGYSMWSLNATTWYLFFAGKPFGQVDPVFHLDLSFYVYRLEPLLGVFSRVLTTYILFLLIRAVVLAVFIARQRMKVSVGDITQETRRQARNLTWALAVLFLLFSGLSVLMRFHLALNNGPGSFLYGPGFVTSRLSVPIFSWLHVAALLLVTASLVWLALRSDKTFTVHNGFVTTSWSAWKRPVQAFIAFLGVVILTAAAGELVEVLYVHPNQNTVELPYIQRTIAATRWALGIDKVKTDTFTPTTTLTSSEVQRDQNALDNVRVNDQGQTVSIYNQLQSFKSYFTFPSASVDRYGTQEVYIATREMDISKLPVQTWVNQTLVYTHGYGVAASPVNQFDSDGLPTFLAENTPQQTKSPLPKVTQPNIYFGLMDNNVVAPSKQGEFDYPSGAGDHTSHYQGGYGLPLKGNRLFLAIKQGSLKFYTSDQFTSQSLWLFDRNIYQRVEDIAPFLTYDQDAYPFIGADGHIKWLLDAYTESPNIPYAQDALQTAYIRNSVKVVIDAYTGKVTFYVVQPQDPMIQSLMAVYPNLFTTKIPESVRQHFRYPQDLFTAQANALTRYHMTTAPAFYNQEDLWSPAKQVYEQNQTKPRAPVYQMIRMPDQTQPQFVLSELFTPANKDNLNGWLIASNEPATYGQLTLYSFPQSQLIFGPMQAENQIDSNPTISQQLTLWNQQGSHVTRGNLLLVPLGNSLLYVEPVYLVADRQNSLPQLERVIVDYNKQVFMDTSLGNAVQDLLNSNNSASQPESNVPTGNNGAGNNGTGGSSSNSGSAGATGGATPGNGSAASLIGQADKLFQQYQTDTANGNFAAAGQDLNQLGQVLNQLQKAQGQSGSSAANATNKTASTAK